MDALQNTYAIDLATFFGGMVATVIAQRILNKRSLFTYFVNHQRIGISAEDQIFGTIKVTLNGNDVTNLYLSTVELTNQSVNDFQDIEVRAYSNDTNLLTERAEIVGTTRAIAWTEQFREQLHVKDGTKPSKQQQDLFYTQRHYLVPILNRGQTVRLTFLNDAKLQVQPSVWLDVLHKGVRLQFRVPKNLIWGVEQTQATLIGAVAVLALIVTLYFTVKVNIVLAVMFFLIGLFSQIPGVLIIKAWRKIRDIFAS